MTKKYWKLEGDFQFEGETKFEDKKSAFEQAQIYASDCDTPGNFYVLELIGIVSSDGIPETKAKTTIKYLDSEPLLGLGARGA